MVKEQIECILEAAFHPTFLVVRDDSAKHAGHAGAREGGHFSIEITSATFAGKKSIDAHRMIYAALQPIKHEIHALAIKAKSS